MQSVKRMQWTKKNRGRLYKRKTRHKKMPSVFAVLFCFCCVCTITQVFLVRSFVCTIARFILSFTFFFPFIIIISLFLVRYFVLLRRPDLFSTILLPVLPPILVIDGWELLLQRIQGIGLTLLFRFIAVKLDVKRLFYWFC